MRIHKILISTKYNISIPANNDLILKRGMVILNIGVLQMLHNVQVLIFNENSCFFNIQIQNNKLFQSLNNK